MERTPEAYARGILAAVLEPWIDGLAQVGKTLRDNGTLNDKLSDAALSNDERLALLRSLTPANAPTELINLLSAMTANDDLRLVDEVANLLGRVISEDVIGPQPAYITSAIALTADEQAQVQSRLTNQFGPNLEFHFQTDPDILGGIIIRVGDKLIDDSVRGRIETLRHSLGVRAA